MSSDMDHASDADRDEIFRREDEAKAPPVQPAWRSLPWTEKQKDAIFNMRFALGLKGDALHKMPETRGEASDEIKSLKDVIVNNLSIGGSINPRRSVYADEL